MSADLDLGPVGFHTLAGSVDPLHGLGEADAGPM